MGVVDAAGADAVEAVGFGVVADAHRGGYAAAVRICHIAEAHGLTVISHGGMNYPYGQHLSYAMPAIQWGERSEGVSPPGVPLEERVVLPGTPVIKDGYLIPSDAPGFGIEVTLDWLESKAV